MKASLLALIVAATGRLVHGQQRAPDVLGNPQGDFYQVNLIQKTDTRLQGYFTAVAVDDGPGVILAVHLVGFPPRVGPFTYHIHANPVPSDGNCTRAGPHFDPFNRGDTTSCDSNVPADCQVGDLSGKYGRITPTSDWEGGNYTTVYRELTLSTQQGTPAFIGDRSIVVHDVNNTRINCGNFRLVNNNTIGSSDLPFPTAIISGSDSDSGSGAGPSSTMQPTNSGEAAMRREVAGTLALVAAVIAFLI